MYTPRRHEDDEIQATASMETPVRIASSPFYSAVKSAQNKATHDFDRFYENLQHKLSPSTSENRFVRRTPNITEKLRPRLNQKTPELDSPTSRTSLTPYFERHSINEDARDKYQNRFEDSDVEPTPSLSGNIDDTPLSYTSFEKRSSIYRSPKYSKSTPVFKREYTTEPESSRLNQLSKKLSEVRRLSYLLVDQEPPVDIFEDHDEEEEPRIKVTRTTLTPKRTPVLHYRNQQLVTPPQSSDYHKTIKSIQTLKSPLPSTPRRSFANNLSTKKPKLNETPRRSFFTDLSIKKLKSTETITTPRGSRVPNRYWQEIHGSSKGKQPILSSPSPKCRSTIETKLLKPQQSWTDEDGDFWSSDSPNKLLNVVNEERETPISPRNVKKRNTYDDEDEESLYRNRLFKAQKATHCLERKEEQKQCLQNLFTEIESANNRDEIMKRNNIPNVFPNVLAELKAKHGNKLIDDSDSYKFT